MVVAQHLGDYSALTESGGYVNVCPYHGYGYVEEPNLEHSNPIVENTLIPDAQQLIQSAQNLLSMADPYSPGYANLQGAIDYLYDVISRPNPSTSDVALAMGQLTQAMAGI